MKNLNPSSGLKQITSGYICIPRKIILELIKDKTIKPLELGYFIIFLISADWDSDKYRRGFIRRELINLSKIWNIPYTTLHDQLTKLISKNLLITEKDTPKIKYFEKFTSKGAQTYAKENKLTDEDLEVFFPILFNNSEISDSSQINDSRSFNVSSKVESDVYPKKVFIKQEVRSDDEYKELQKKHDLSVDDMKWIDKDVTETLEVKNEATESDYVEIFFDGDWDKYQKSLVAT